jgi:prepilin-type processing-associated H-X9-DG protein
MPLALLRSSYIRLQDGSMVARSVPCFLALLREEVVNQQCPWSHRNVDLGGLVSGQECAPAAANWEAERVDHPDAGRGTRHDRFCPSVGKDRLFDGNVKYPTFGFNGTTYIWNHQVDPRSNANPFSKRPPIQVSGLAVAAIPRPSEAPALWDMPYLNPFKEPCTSLQLQPPHAKGINVLFADTHVKFTHFDDKQAGSSPCMEDWWASHHWEGYYE